MALRERLVYAIDVVTDGVDTGLNRINKAIKEADGATGKLKAGWSAAVSEFKNSREAQAAAFGAASAVAVKAISDYSNLNESINAVTVQYGDQSDAVLALGEDSAEGFGMSQRAFNEFAVGFSAFADQIAANSGQQVADVVGDMATRIADFASVHNLSLQEAEQVAKSTLAGETEAFRRFGGDVSAATVEAYAYQQGIAEVGAELTEGQKTLARYGLFMDQTAKTQGDFANTSGGLANQQRILAAKVEDLSAKLGGKLYPAASDAAGAVLMLADALDYLGDATGSAKSAMPGFVQDIASFGERFVNPVKQLGFVNEGLKELRGSAEDATPKVLDLADADKRLAVGAERVAQAQSAANLAIEGTSTAADMVASSIELALSNVERFGSDGVENMEDVTDAADDTSEAVDDVRASFQDLRDEIKARSDYRNLEAAFDDIKDAAIEAYGAAAEGADDAAAKVRNYAAEQDSLRTEVLDYMEALGEIPAQKSTAIMALIDQQMYDEALRLLTELERERIINVRINTGQISGDLKIGGGRNYAAGTLYHPGGAASFNEPGNPEMAIFPDGRVFMPDMPTGSKVLRVGRNLAPQSAAMFAGGSGMTVIDRGTVHHHYHEYLVVGANGATSGAAQRRVRGMM